jgi:hypothetical protein
MAEIQQTQTLPAPFIEAAGKTYLEDLSKAVGGIKGLDLSKLYGSQFVAGPSALQTQAEGLSTGLGGYQPFLQAAQAATGPTAYQQYMSPYQQDVISTTLSEFDRQSQMGLPALQSQAVQAGAFGQGRGQVAEAEYQSASDRNRAALQAQLLQQGFGQAQSLAAQQYNQQLGLAGQTQGLLGQQIAGIKYTRCTTTSTRTSRINCKPTTSLSTRLSTITSNTSLWTRCNRFDCWISWSNRNSTNSISYCITNWIRSCFNFSRNLWKIKSTYSYSNRSNGIK